MDSDEGIVLGMGDEAIEQGGNDEIEVRDVECIRAHRDRKKQVIYDMSDPLDMIGSQHGNSRAEKLIRILYDKELVLIMLKDMVMSVED